MLTDPHSLGISVLSLDDVNDRGQHRLRTGMEAPITAMNSNNTLDQLSSPSASSTYCVSQNIVEYHHFFSGKLPPHMWLEQSHIVANSGTSGGSVLFVEDETLFYAPDSCRSAYRVCNNETFDVLLDGQGSLFLILPNSLSRTQPCIGYSHRKVLGSFIRPLTSCATDKALLKAVT